MQETTMHPQFEGDCSKLFEGLLAVQKELKNIPKEGKGAKKWQNKQNQWQEFKYTYALFKDVVPAAVRLLAPQGIFILQTPFPNQSDGNLYVTTYLIHAETGGKVWFHYPVCAIKGMGQQDMAAANTAAKRHSIVEALIMVADDDADAQDTTASTATDEQPIGMASSELKKVTTSRTVKQTKTAQGEPEELTTQAPTAEDLSRKEAIWERVTDAQAEHKDFLAMRQDLEAIGHVGLKDGLRSAIDMRDAIYRATVPTDLSAAKAHYMRIPQDWEGLDKLAAIYKKKAAELKKGQA